MHRNAMSCSVASHIYCAALKELVRIAEYHWAIKREKGIAMDYETAMSRQPISKDEADREIRRHGLDPMEFWNEWTKRRAPNSRDVLLWLGY